MPRSSCSAMRRCSSARRRRTLAAARTRAQRCALRDRNVCCAAAAVDSSKVVFARWRIGGIGAIVGGGICRDKWPVVQSTQNQPKSAPAVDCGANTLQSVVSRSCKAALPPQRSITGDRRDDLRPLTHWHRLEERCRFVEGFCHCGRRLRLMQSRR